MVMPLGLQLRLSESSSCGPLDRVVQYIQGSGWGVAKGVLTDTRSWNGHISRTTIPISNLIRDSKRKSSGESIETFT